MNNYMNVVGNDSYTFDEAKYLGNMMHKFHMLDAVYIEGHSCIARQCELLSQYNNTTDSVVLLRDKLNYEYGTENFQIILGTIKNIFAAILNFLKSLAIRIMEFFGLLGDRTEKNAEGIREDLLFIKNKIDNKETTPEVVVQGIISPAVQRRDLEYHGMAAKVFSDALLNTFKDSELEREITALLNSITEGSSVPKFKPFRYNQDLSKYAGELGFIIPNPMDDEKSAKEQVQYRSTLSQKASLSVPTMLKDLGYSELALRAIATDTIESLVWYQKELKKQSGVLQVLINRCELVRKDLDNNSKIQKTNSDNPEELYTKTKRISHEILKLSTLMVLNTHACAMIDEYVGYHRKLVAIAANEVKK